MFDIAKYPYCYSGYTYARDVVDGKIPVGKPVLDACKRFFRDMEDQHKEDCSFYFNPDKAERYLRLVQKFKHVKGVWDNPYIVYEPWQNFAFMNIEGFFRKDSHYRRFRTAHVEIARGNAKSTKASQAGLYHLSLNDPVGNEIYSAATSRDQAVIVLDAAMKMAKANPGFLRNTGVEVLANKITHDKSGSFFRALSADYNSLDGLLPALAIIDELHAHKNRKVFDVIDSAMSKRKDSLLLVITTAGFDNTNIGYSQSVYAKKVASGDVEDNTFFSLVFCPDDEDDISLEDTWRKANPNYGVSVDPVNFASKFKKSLETPDSLNNFKVKHLNIWTNSASPFFNIDRWDECSENISIEDFKGHPCWVGIDLSSKIDLTTFSYVFKKDKKYYIFLDAFVPEDTVAESTNESYPSWVESGDLNATPGEAINYMKLQERLVDASRKFKIQGVMYDPWNATEFAQRMEQKRINMIEFRMNTANLSEPMKKLDAIIRERRAINDGNKVLRFCLGNVVAKRDNNDNVFPRKENEKMKIDGAVSTIMALAGFVNDESNESVYERRGIVVL